MEAHGLLTWTWTGLVHNIFMLTVNDDTNIPDALETQFAAEPLFLQVVLTIHN